MIFVAFAFALWVNNLGAPEADVTLYDVRSAITVDPFAKKIHIQGEGEPGNKIGISRTVIAQSGAEERFSSPRDTILWETSARSAFESRLNHWGNVSIKLIDSRGIAVDSTLRLKPLAVLIQRRL